MTNLNFSRVFTAAGAAILVSGAALPAHAEDAWQAFWDRCLHPVSNVIMPNTNDLSEEGANWMAPDRKWSMEIDIDRGEIFSCSVTTESAEEALADFREWARVAVETESYQELPRNFLPDTAIAGYESHLWREPRIQVIAEEKKGFVKFTVEETELEALTMPKGDPPHA